VDKIDFINRIISLYPHAIKDHETQFDTYNRALPATQRADYEEAYNLFCVEYKDSFPPAPGVLRELALKCLKQEATQAQKWIHVKIYNPILKAVINTDCFPAGTSENTILNTYKHHFGGEGWKIIEVC
jgi:hypothetical protein